MSRIGTATFNIHLLKDNLVHRERVRSRVTVVDGHLVWGERRFLKRREMKSLLAFYERWMNSFQCLGGRLCSNRQDGTVAQATVSAHKAALRKTRRKSCMLCATKNRRSRCIQCGIRIDLAPSKAGQCLGIRCAECFQIFCVKCLWRHFKKEGL